MDNRPVNGNLKATMFAICLGGVALLLLGGSPSHAQGWHFGIGTGMTFMNIKGDQGMTLPNFGPVQYEIELDPDQFSDAMESGFGLGGYATDGKWMFQYSAGHMTLGGQGEGVLSESVGEGTFTYDLDFDITFAKLTVGNTIYRSKNMKFAFTPYAGMRYMEHEITFDFSATQGSVETYVYRNRANDWTDFLIGAGISYRLGPKVSWSMGGDAGFGGSNGAFFFTSSLMISPGKHFSFGPNFTYTAHDFENGEIGDVDWYLYDANEYGAGIAFMFNI